MQSQTVAVEVPEALIERLGSLEEVVSRVRRSLVLDLLREADISQGEAALLLNLTRYDILDLMARYRIPAGPLTDQEAVDELETVGRLAQSLPIHAGGQR